MGLVTYVGPAPEGVVLVVGGRYVFAPKGQAISVPDDLEAQLLQQGADWDPAADGAPVYNPPAAPVIEAPMIVNGVLSRRSGAVYESLGLEEVPLVEGVDWRFVNGAARRPGGDGVFTITRRGNTLALYGAVKHVPADGTSYVELLTPQVDPTHGVGFLPIAYQEDSGGVTNGAVVPSVSAWSGQFLTFYNEDPSITATHFELWFGGQAFQVKP